ncbi:MAG TPA: TMEM175 family protein [Cyclobacteriaceae bacterium]|nr:TMEM175 family protein [Cyclobacteriaceae bacterium]
MNRFPNDRVNNFSDAIFAIAITLLILEVKTPSAGDIQALGLIGALDKLFPSFVSLLVSFFVTALYWRAHLANGRYISSYDNKLLWLNIWLLLFVVALPFSTALYSKNFGSTATFIFYAINLGLIGVFNYWMVNYTIKKEGFSEALTPVTARWLKFRAFPAPMIWFFSAVLATVMPLTARFLFVTIFLVQAIGDRRYKKALTLETSRNAENS